MKKHLAIVLLLLAARLAMAENSYECSYMQKNGADWVTEQHCLTCLENGRQNTAGGDARISKEVAARASYNENGLAYLFSPAGVFYFTRAGLVRKTINYDNGPDDFSDGLARTERNGKIGFFDQRLSMVSLLNMTLPFPLKTAVRLFAWVAPA